MPRFNIAVIIKFLTKTIGLALLLVGLISLVAPATVDAASTNVPTKYKSVSADGSANPLDNEFYCEFRSSAHVYCWRSASTDLNSTDGTEGEKSYWFDPDLSKSAGHDVFRPDDGAKTAEYGWMHFPNSASGDYSLAVVSTLPIASSKTIQASDGVADNDVDTNNFKTDPDSTKICSLEMFKKGDKAVSCDVGDDPIRSVTSVTYKSGFSSFREVKKCDKGGLGFVLCPIQNMMVDVVSQLNEWMADLLSVNTLGFQNDTLKTASQNILNITNSIYALLFLVIIFANGLSIGLDSYALKKLVPRLVAAIILSQFAFFITGAFIELGNVLGRSVSQFFTSLIPATTERAGAAGGISVAILGIGAVLLVISMLVIIIIALLVVLAVLAIRWAALYALILLAPLAFAAHVLPNTDKLWKAWWTNLVKLVLMFPIIMAITSGAAFLSAVMISKDSPAVIQVVGALLPFIGFLLIPKAFKWSGSLMAATGGKIAEYGTKKAKSSAREGTQAKLTNKIGDKALSGASKVPVFGGALSNSRLATAAQKNIGQRQKRIESKEGLDSVDGKRLEKMAMQGHKGAKAEVGKKYTEELEKQESRAAKGLDVDATKLVKLRKVLGTSEGGAERDARTATESARLSAAANRYMATNPGQPAPEISYVTGKAADGRTPSTEQKQHYFEPAGGGGRAITPVGAPPASGRAPAPLAPTAGGGVAVAGAAPNHDDLP